jgi:hypothetical protein
MNCQFWLLGKEEALNLNHIHRKHGDKPVDNLLIRPYFNTMAVREAVFDLLSFVE